ncbi:MAG: TRAP transporter substrate-binding protein [Rhodocyclaceae bacterium]
MKKLALILAALCVGVAIYAFSSRPDAAQGTILLRFAYASNSQPVKDAMAEFGRTLTERTGGRVQMLYFPESQLGGERELIELMQTGAVDIVKVSGGLLESFAPRYGVFSMPYLFDSEAHFYRAMETPAITEPIYTSTRPLGFEALTYYDSGQRSFYTRDKPIRELADMKGLKIRVMQSQTAIRMVRLLGGAPIAMANSETYSAIQQGILDGAENNEFAMTVARHAEVAKHYTYDVHTRVPDIVLINSKVLAKLPADVRQAVTEAAHASTVFEKTAWRRAIEAAQAECRERFGVQFHQVDIKAFQQAVAPLYEELKSKPELYETYQQIRRVADGAPA